MGLDHGDTTTLYHGVPSAPWNPAGDAPGYRPRTGKMNHPGHVREGTVVSIGAELGIVLVLRSTVQPANRNQCNGAPKVPPFAPHV